MPRWYRALFTFPGRYLSLFFFSSSFSLCSSWENGKRLSLPRTFASRPIFNFQTEKVCRAIFQASSGRFAPSSVIGGKGRKGTRSARGRRVHAKDRNTRCETNILEVAPVLQRQLDFRNVSSASRLPAPPGGISGIFPYDLNTISEQFRREGEFRAGVSPDSSLCQSFWLASSAGKLHRIASTFERASA